MSALPAKQRVRSAFERAATSYDAAAALQREVCELLLAGLHAVPAPATILDAGCGTGYGSRLLRTRWPAARLTALDFAPAMVRLARSSADHGLVADMEALPCADRSFDLWWSSLAIQWCDASRSFAEAGRLLGPGGRLALSTLGPNTFHELRSAFAGVDGYRHTIGFSTPGDTAAALAAAGFHKIEVQTRQLQACYPDLKSLLRAVKAIGANAVGNGARSGLMARTAWQAFEAAYETHRGVNGLPATYDVILAYAEK